MERRWEWLKGIESRYMNDWKIITADNLILQMSFCQFIVFIVRLDRPWCVLCVLLGTEWWLFIVWQTMMCTVRMYVLGTEWWLFIVRQTFVGNRLLVVYCMTEPDVYCSLHVFFWEQNDDCLLCDRHLLGTESWYWAVNCVDDDKSAIYFTLCANCTHSPQFIIIISVIKCWTLSTILFLVWL